jgi:hypothetical protein
MPSMLLFILGIIKISSMNTTTNLSNSGMNTEFIRYVKWAGAFVNPKDITRYSIPCSECGLGYIFGSDTDLMVTRPEVNLGKYPSSGKLIK